MVRRCEPNEWDNNQIYNISRVYERLLERLMARQPTENKETYERYLKRAQIEGISLVRRLNYMRALLILKKVMRGNPVETVDRRHVDLFLDSISHNSPATIQLRVECLRRFLKFIGKGELTEGVKTSGKKEIRVRASDLLTREDVQKLLDAASTKRGRAFIMMLYESGARIGGILNTKLRDLQFDTNGVLVEIQGKTGKRRIRLVESTQYLKDWMDEIKLLNPNAIYLWFGVKENEPSQYAAMVKFLRKTVKAAGLRKKVYPHLFRHSRASELAQKLKESQLRAFMGWTGGSDMPRVYIHLSAQDMDRAILDLYKVEDTQKTESLDEITKFYEMFKKFKALG